MVDDPSLQRGLEVVAAIAPMEPSVADLVDALEGVLDGPDDIRRVLEQAEQRGMIEREEARVTTGSQAATGFRTGRVIKRLGEFSCRRCSRQVTTGHFLRVGETEIGPYGSTCIDRITDRR